MECLLVEIKVLEVQNGEPQNLQGDLNLKTS